MMDRPNFTRALELHSEAASMFARVILHPGDRETCANWLAKRLSADQGPFPQSPAAAELAGRGVTFMTLGVTAAQVADINRALAPGDTSGARFEHSVAAVLEAPHLLELATSEIVLATVAGYLRARPILADMRSWWSFAGDGQGDQVFHRDVNGVRFCKLFIYLTDVDLENGPHQFVAGSHRLDHVTERVKRGGGTEQILAQMFGRADQQVEDALVSKFHGDDLITITGKAGTAFLENTYGIHKAVPPRSGARLIFSALYSLTLDPNASEGMSHLRGNSDWMDRVPNTPLAQYAVSPWVS